MTELASSSQGQEVKMSEQEFKIFNGMADRMDRFHNHYRATWTEAHKACETGQRPNGMSIKQFLAMIEEFCDQVTAHHTFEERNIYPLLATRMPAFRTEVELLTQHKAIHEGIDRLYTYVKSCQHGDLDFRLKDLQDVMDSFGTVLWEHLDDEVKQLGADKMRKYWTAAEMRRLVR